MNENYNAYEEEEVISIQEILDSLKKRWKMIAAITVACTLVAVIVSFFVIKPTYEASTKMFIGKEESSTEGYNTNDIQMYQKLLQTYAETIKTTDLIERSLAGTNYDITAEDVKSALTVSPLTDTQILQIKYQSNNPEAAAEVLNNISQEFITTSISLVPNGNVKIIESVKVPENPVAPNKKMNVAIALLLGLMVGCGLAFLLEYMDNTVNKKDKLEKLLPIPVLGDIPLEDDEIGRSKKHKKRKNR